MLVEEYIRQKERAEFERKPSRHRINPLMLMVTYERPGALTATLDSFFNTTSGMVLHVLDDGSSSDEKKAELDKVETRGVMVHRMPHRGIGPTWMEIFRFAKENASGHDSVVFLEDDLRFSVSWLDVMASILLGSIEKGYKTGMVTCFRAYDDACWECKQVEVVGGVEVFRPENNSFQANIFLPELLDNMGMMDEAAMRAESEGWGIDKQLCQDMREKMGRVNFCSVRSYIEHTGCGRNPSIAREHGYVCYPFRGFNLVHELMKKE